MAGDWTADDLADLLTPFAARLVDAHPPGCCSGSAALRRGPPAARGAQHGRRLAGEHPPPLRPVQRPVRAVPRRDDDLLVGAGSPTRQRRRSPTPSAARSTAARPGARRAGHARAGDRHRLGRAGDPGRAAGRAGDHAHHLGRAGPARRASGCAEAGRRRPRPRAAARLPRGAGQLRRGRQRRDDRGGRRAATGRPTSPPSTGCSRPAAGSGCRRSRCRTTGCSRRAATTPGSTSTSSRAGSSRRCRRSRSTWPRTRRCGWPSSAASGEHYARTLRALAGAASVALGRPWPRSASTSTFRRMWDFYLAYCEAGFRVGYLDVVQFSLARPMSTARSPRSSPGSSSASSARPCPSGSGRGTAARPGATDGPRRGASGTAGRCAACCGARRARPRPGVRRRRPRRRGRPRRRALPVLDAGEGRTGPPGASGSDARRSRPPGWRCGSARSAPGRGRPASEARLDGRLHTRRRDRAAIAHHYDLSNDFYAFLLDPQMAYSCGYWTQEPSPPTASPTPSATSST